MKVTTFEIQAKDGTLITFELGSYDDAAIVIDRPIDMPLEDLMEAIDQGRDIISLLNSH